MAYAPDYMMLIGVGLGLMACAGLAGASFAATARRHGWVDAPDPRRLHTRPTPRGGGFGIALALGIVLVLMPPDGAAWAWLLAGLVVTAGAGLVDDIRPLPPALKLLGQAAGTLPLALAWPLDHGLPHGIGVAASWLLAIGLVNAWNFMDGSDGLVTLQGIVVGAAAFALPLLAGVATGTEAFGAMLAFACVGFLPLNFPRAVVFLGDVGSHALGYASALLLLSAQDAGGAVAALAWLPLLAILVDAGVTLLARVRRGEAPWRAHRTHLFQRLVAAGASHRAVAIGYALCSGAAAGLALLCAGVDTAWAWGAVAAVALAGIIVRVVAGRRWPVVRDGDGER